MQIFISSTTQGLEPERAYLPTLLEAVGHKPLRFEDFTAQNKPSRRACLDGLAQADVYVLILGSAYGWVPEDSRISATEEEFQAAQQRGLPILVFRKEGTTPEPAQAEFMERVGSYQTGRFWKTFTDEKTLGPAVLAALRDLQVPQPPLIWRPVDTPPTVTWRRDRPTVQEAGRTEPVLEAHLLPSGAQGALLPVSGLANIANQLAAHSRSSGFFGQADALTIRHDAASAWAFRGNDGPSRPNPGFISKTDHRYAGLVLDRSGAAMAFQSLPTDMFGALVDLDDLRQRLAVLLRALAPHLPASVENVALAAAIDPAHTVYEGDPGEVGKRNSSSMRSTSNQVVRVTPDDQVPRPAVASGTAEIADELAARLLEGVRALRY